MTQSLPHALFETTLQGLVEDLELNEITGENGGPYMSLISHMPMAQGEVGAVRVYESEKIAKVVTCSIVVPQIFLDSHMIFAFTQDDSAVPHFTLDSVKAGEHYSFHLDLIPRVDLGANIDYMNEVFHPLTDLHELANKTEGLSPAHITPRQRAIMSPWMLVNRADESAFSQIGQFVEQYRKYWLSVLDAGVKTSVSKEQVKQRDKANRAAIFNVEIDPVWGRINGLIGEQAGQQLRALLRGE